MKSASKIVLAGLCLLLVALVVRVAPVGQNRTDKTNRTDNTVATTTAAAGEINPDLAPQAGAVVSAVEGPSTIVRGDAKLAAAVGMAVKSEDRIEVGATSTLVVTWPHYGRSTFAGGSVVDVAVAFESTDRRSFLGSLLLQAGRVWSRFEHTFGPNAHFEVRAADVVATVRGTSFGVGRTGDVVDVEVMESEVAVSRVDAVTQQALGAPVMLGPKQWMKMTSATAWPPATRAMGAATQDDPFVKRGNTAMTADELTSY